MERLTEKRNGENVIPLRNAVCGLDVPHWSLDKATDLEMFLRGAAADRLAAYEDTGVVPAKLSEIQNEAYDLGYQSCLNYKGLKWPEAEELQRYREAGLTPEEVDQIRRAAESMLFENTGDFVRYSLSNFEELLRYRETGMDPEHAAMWEKNRRNSVTIGRMAEFLEAEKDGRVVLLTKQYAFEKDLAENEMSMATVDAKRFGHAVREALRMLEREAGCYSLRDEDYFADVRTFLEQIAARLDGNG